MSDFKLELHIDKVTAEIEKRAVAFLYEAAGEMQAQVQRNTAVDTGQLKSSWQYTVDESKKEAIIGSPLENAIWEEFGTGEYAVNGNGRKTPWKYKDRHGKWHYTTGKRPRKALQNAYATLKPKLIARAQKIFGGLK